MALDINETQIQLKIVNSLFPAVNFLQKTFFPNSGASLSNTIKIKNALFTNRVASQVAGANSSHEVVTYPSYGEVDVVPPYIKEEYAVDNEATKTVSNTTGINVGKSPAEIARDKRGDMLADMKNSVYRRIEQYSGQLLTQGKVTLDDNTEITYDFPADHLIDNAAGDYWSVANTDIIDQIRVWVRKVASDSGVAPTTLVLGNKAYRSLLGNSGIQKLFDNRNITVGQIDTRLEALMGAVYVGRLNEVAIDIWAYAGSYSVGSNQVFFIPENRIVLGSKNPKAASLEWGAINRTDVTGAIEIFTGVWNDEKMGRQSQLLEARPLPVFSNPSAFLSAKVVA